MNIWFIVHLLVTSENAVLVAIFFEQMKDLIKSIRFLTKLSLKTILGSS